MLSFHRQSLKQKPLPRKDVVFAIPNHEINRFTVKDPLCWTQKRWNVFLVLNSALGFHGGEHNICRFLVDRSDSR